jgi:transketolase
MLIAKPRLEFRRVSQIEEKIGAAMTIQGMTQLSREEPQERIRALRRKIIQVSARAQEGHIPSAFSILDILWVLYQGVLDANHDVLNKGGRDRFILSKGHASLGLYAILAELGRIEWSEFERFAEYDGLLGGHPDRNKVPGVEASTGSLGHGFPIAVGLAMGLRIRAVAGRVYTLVGDGESNEGAVWEAALLASHHHLTNLCCIVDYNHSGDRALEMGDVGAKFESFGWEKREVDGHDHRALLGVLRTLSSSRPTAVIASTIKGYGCKVMENEPAWHHKSPGKRDLAEVLKAMS